MLKQGLLKSVQSAANADLKLSGRVYLGLGKLSTRCPDIFASDVYLLSLLLSMLEQVISPCPLWSGTKINNCNESSTNPYQCPPIQILNDYTTQGLSRNMTHL